MVFSKILFPKLLDSFPPNAGTVYFKRAKEKPVGVSPHSCPVAGGSCPHKGNCFRLRIFECFEQMGFQEESNRRNWGTNFTRNWRAFMGVLNKQASKGKPPLACSNTFDYLEATGKDTSCPSNQDFNQSSDFHSFLVLCVGGAKAKSSQGSPAFRCSQLWSEVIIHPTWRIAVCHLAKTQPAISRAFS